MDITLKSRKNKHLNAKECYIIEAVIGACVKNIVLFIH